MGKDANVHRVLAHQNLPLTAQSLTDLVHLRRADIVHRDHEDRRWPVSKSEPSADARYFSINVRSFSK